LFFEQVFSGGFAAILAERLCLSGATEKTLRLRRRGASIGSQINGKPEAFRKDSGKAAHPVLVAVPLLCASETKRSIRG
jgi:hypothetical protein